MSFKEFAKELNGKRVEGELTKAMFYSVLTGLVTLAVLYFVKLRSVSDFVPKYGLFIFLVILSYAIITPAIRQIRAYGQCNCMTGMMVGMTTGMVAGFLPGFYVGATNGIFFGSIFGMITGIGLGIWAGNKCCGVMGLMEGTMAGFMGALMGAMTVLMTFNDNLKAMAVVVFAISAFIMISLNYTIFKETKESEMQFKEDHSFTIALIFIIVTITIWFMVFGPKGGLLA